MPDSSRYESVPLTVEDQAEPHIREIDEDRTRSWSSMRTVRLAVVGSLAAAGVYYTKTRTSLLDAGAFGRGDERQQLVEVLPEVPLPLEESGTASADDDGVNTFTTGLKAALYAASESDNFLFGHHMSSYSGQFFWDKESKHHFSDVMNSTGKFPLVYGFDFAKVLDGDGDFVQHIEDAYTRGGVMSFMWLTPNPATGGDSYDKTGRPCVNIMEGGSANAVWTAYLDSISDFLKSIHPIPVVFRLFHEMTGWWYWWGTDHCTDDEFISAWQYTVEYLRDTKGNDNLLMFYATSRIANDFTPKQRHEVKISMYDRYPGDDYVDAIGFDCYDNLTYYAQSLNNTCEEIFTFAQEKNKIPLIGETGHTHGMTCTNCGEWFDELLTVMRDPNSKCSQAAYAITWENYNTGNYYVPLPFQKQYAGFMDFVDSGVPQLQHSQEWHKFAWDNGYFQNQSEANNVGAIQVYGGDDDETKTSTSTVGGTLTTDDDTLTDVQSGDDTTTDSSGSHPLSSSSSSDTDSCGKGCTNDDDLADSTQRPSAGNFEPGDETPTADSHPSLSPDEDDEFDTPTVDTEDGVPGTNVGDARPDGTIIGTDDSPDGDTPSPSDETPGDDFVAVVDGTPGTNVGDARPDGTIIGADDDAATASLPADDVGADDFTDVDPEPNTETISCGKGCTTQAPAVGSSGATSVQNPVIPDGQDTSTQKKFSIRATHQAPK